MSCVSPITLRTGHSVPCQRCGFCLRRRSDEWSVRLWHELQESVCAHFITLTYEDKYLPMRDLVDQGTGEFYGVSASTLSKRDLQLFFKKLRKKNSLKIKYYAVGEYGSKTERPHYHAIVFNLEGAKEEVYWRILSSWEIGQIHTGTVTQQSIDYVTSYIQQRFDQRFAHVQQPFALISNGIGKAHRDKNSKYYKTQPAKNEKGMTVALPRYYKQHQTDSEKIANNKKVAELRQEKFKYSVEELSKMGYLDPISELRQRQLANSDKLISKSNKKKL